MLPVRGSLANLVKMDVTWAPKRPGCRYACWCGACSHGTHPREILQDGLTMLNYSLKRNYFPFWHATGLFMEGSPVFLIPETFHLHLDAVQCVYFTLLCAWLSPWSFCFNYQVEDVWFFSWSANSGTRSWRQFTICLVRSVLSIFTKDIGRFTNSTKTSCLECSFIVVPY